MARTKAVAAQVETVSVEERVARALERIAAHLERLPGTGTLNTPAGPIPAVAPAAPAAYQPPSVKEGPVGTLAEETAKLHAAVEKQKAKAAPPPAPEPDPLADMLGEAPAESRTATFEEARKALVDAAQEKPKGIGPDKVLAVLKESLGVERLSLHPKDDVAGFGRFLSALEAAVGRR